MKSPVSQLAIEGIVIDIEQKNIKNINLSVRRDRIRISAPRRVSIEKIRSFALSKIDWIKKAQAKLQSRASEKPLEYAEGETHFLRGKPYSLKIAEHDRAARAEFHNGTIELFAKPDAPIEKKMLAMAKWYAEELARDIPPLIAKWEPVIWVRVQAWGIKKMRSKWGVCHIGIRKIVLGLELAKKSPEYLEYVVVHEMVHLLEASHNARFKGFMTRFLPHWKDLKTGLNGRIEEDDVSDVVE